MTKKEKQWILSLCEQLKRIKTMAIYRDNQEEWVIIYDKKINNNLCQYKYVWFLLL